MMFRAIEICKDLIKTGKIPLGSVVNDIKRLPTRSGQEIEVIYKNLNIEITYKNTHTYEE